MTAAESTTLLTDELRAYVGRTASYTAPEELGRAAIRYFARAVGDDNSLYTSDAYAIAHGYDGIIAPPTLICETNQYVDRPRDADGFIGHSWDLSVPGTRLVRGGNAYTFHQPVRPADVVTATWCVADLTERTTGSGQQMLVLTSTARFINHRDELLAENVETLIYVELATSPPAGSDPSQSARPMARAQSQESWDAARIEIGTELPPLERTIEQADMVAYAGATWDWHRLHYDPAYLADKQLPAAVVDGQVFGALLTEQLQDALGPRAAVRSLHFRFKNLVYAGETVRCTAQVTGVDGDLVTVESRVQVVGPNARTAVAPSGAQVQRR